MTKKRLSATAALFLLFCTPALAQTPSHIVIDLVEETISITPSSAGAQQLPNILDNSGDMETTIDGSVKNEEVSIEVLLADGGGDAIAEINRSDIFAAAGGNMMQVNEGEIGKNLNFIDLRTSDAPQAMIELEHR